jgi:ATP phosphoribosyltransferase
MIRLGVPSKGRLMQDCLDWFGARGVVMRRTGSDREYSVAVEGIGGVVPVLLSAGEIPRDLATGRIHLGVNGSDLVREQLVDLDAAAAAFRKAHGHRLRIATKYHRLVRNFLQAQGVADYQLVDSQGATEGTVKNGTAEAIADITSSGETLRANHLRILSDGLIHSSEAVLWASTAAEWTAEGREAMGRLAGMLKVRLPI